MTSFNYRNCSHPIHMSEQVALGQQIVSVQQYQGTFSKTPFSGSVPTASVTAGKG